MPLEGTNRGNRARKTSPAALGSVALLGFALGVVVGLYLARDGGPGEKEDAGGMSLRAVSEAEKHGLDEAPVSKPAPGQGGDIQRVAGHHDGETQEGEARGDGASQDSEREERAEERSRDGRIVRFRGLSDDVRNDKRTSEVYDHVLGRFDVARKATNPHLMTNFEGYFIESLWFGKKPEKAHGDAFVALLRGIGIEDLDEAQVEWLGQTVNKYVGLVGEHIKEVDEMYGLQELPLSHPVFREAWEERIRRCAEVYHLFIDDLRRELRPQDFEKLARFLSYSQLPTGQEE